METIIILLVLVVLLLVLIVWPRKPKPFELSKDWYKEEISEEDRKRAIRILGDILWWDGKDETKK